MTAGPKLVRSKNLTTCHVHVEYEERLSTSFTHLHLSVALFYTTHNITSCNICTDADSCMKLSTLAVNTHIYLRYAY